MQNTHPYVKKSFLSPNIVKQTTLNISPTKVKQQVRPIVPDMVKPESKNQQTPKRTNVRKYSEQIIIKIKSADTLGVRRDQKICGSFVHN